MKIVVDFIIDNIKYNIKYEAENVELKEVLKIKEFLRKLVTELNNNKFVTLNNFDDYKKYPVETIKVISPFKFSKLELLAYFIVLFFENNNMRFVEFEIEIMNDDIVKIIFDDYSILNKKIIKTIIPPHIRAKFVNFFNFYNKLFF